MRRAGVLALLSLTGCALLEGPPATSQKFAIFFSAWSVALDASAEAEIRAAAALAARLPEAPVVVTGFADARGSAPANAELSHARAQMVTDVLVRDGVAAARIQQAARGATDVSRSAQESRRVEIDVGSI